MAYAAAHDSWHLLLYFGWTINGLCSSTWYIVHTCYGILDKQLDYGFTQSKKNITNATQELD